MSSQSSSPITRAPPTQAISSTRSAPPAAASESFTFCSTEARYISLKKSSALLLAAPSVPMAMGMPAAESLSTGQMPLASFKLEQGLVTAQSCFFWNSATSSLLIHTQWKPPPP